MTGIIQATMPKNRAIVQEPEPEALCGVDEAGRGPVMGPLVIVGVRTRDDGPLREIGVRDSKKCTPEYRERLGPAIRRFCEQVVVRTVSAENIDAMREKMTLNQIEEIEFAETIRDLLTSKFPSGRKPERIKVFVDAADANAQTFRDGILERLGIHIDLISEHKADVNYPVVSAASILAKLIRDSEMEKISKQAGEDVGSGYPADPITIAFIEKSIKKDGALPPHTRKSWETVKRYMRKEKKLDDFVKTNER